MQKSGKSLTKSGDAVKSQDVTPKSQLDGKSDAGPPGPGGLPADHFQRFLRRHLNTENTKQDRMIRYTIDELNLLISTAREVFLAEPTLAEIRPPVVIVGDIHGQFYDMLRMFNHFSDGETHGCLARKYCFLGDYVDRGRRSLECVCLVLTLKILFPKKYVVLRGNHECKAINKVYGFCDEITDRFEDRKEEGEALWKSFNDLFACMPIAGLVGKKILCMHGGIGPTLESLDDIRKIKRPLDDPVVNQLAMDLLWADPMIDLKGFIPNSVRGVSVYFGENTVVEACNRLGIDLIVRAHQMMITGFGFFCHRKLITIFTAPRYFPEKNNKGAVLSVEKDGKVGFKILIPCDETNKGEKQFRDDIGTSNMDDSCYVSYKKKNKKPIPASPATKDG